MNSDHIVSRGESVEEPITAFSLRHGHQDDPAEMPADRRTVLRDAARSLSASFYHVVHQPTSKGRDRSLAALVALIYGPTPFGGVNTLREVAVRYGMTEQNLFRLMKIHRELLKGVAEPEYEI